MPYAFFVALAYLLMFGAIFPALVLYLTVGLPAVNPFDDFDEDEDREPETPNQRR